MDLQFIWLMFRTILALLFILFVLYASMKLGGQKLKNFQGERFIKILERTQLSKENTLFLVKIGQKAYVISSTSGDIKIMYELTKEEISEVETRKIILQYKSLKDFYKKLKDKKEDKNEH